jgi:hypothetical protein
MAAAKLRWAVGLGLAAMAVNGAAQESSRARVQTEVQQLQKIVLACKAAAAACQSKPVGPDETVKAEGTAAGFTLQWGWLREALDSAAKATDGDRQTTMDQAAGHLQEIADDAGAPAREGDFAKARAEATQVLAGKEFAHTEQPSWLDRQMSRFWMLLGRAFDTVGNTIDKAPWLGKLLEWGFFIGAAAALLVFVLRSVTRQRLAISLGTGEALTSAWDKEASDWSALAEQCAAEQQWREAVHCLYWAGIVRLESRRAWRHNPARTPREYVRLLKAGSPQRSALGALTQIFERVWYGLREASDADYRQARALFDGLSGTADRA